MLSGVVCISSECSSCVNKRLTAVAGPKRNDYLSVPQMVTKVDRHSHTIGIEYDIPKAAVSYS